MISILRYSLILFILITNSLYSSEFSDYQKFYDGIKLLDANPNEVYRVENLIIEKDSGKLSLDSGIVCFLQDYGKQKHFAVFFGSGRLHFTPTVRSEKENMKRVFESESLDMSFTKASFVFDNDFFEKVKQNGKNQAGQYDLALVKETHYNTYKHYMHRKTMEIYYGLAYSILDSKRSDFFYAHCFRDSRNHYVWIYDPYEMEENRLFVAEEGMSDDYDRISSVIECESSEDLLLNSDIRANKKEQLITGISYDIDFKMTSSTTYKSTSTYAFKAEKDFSWLKLDIFDLVTVKSVTDEDDNPIYFYHTDYPFDKVLWLRFDQPIKAGEKRSIKFTVSGDLRNRAFIAGYNLYPVYPKDELLNFSLTAVGDQTKELHGFGEKIKDEMDRLRGKRTTEWKYKRPLYALGVMIWNYKEKELEFDIQPEIMTMKHQHVNHADNVIDNYKNGIGFLNTVFGKPDLKKCELYELPYYTTIDSVAGLLENTDDNAITSDDVKDSRYTLKEALNPLENAKNFEERLQILTRNTLYRQARYTDLDYKSLILASDYPEKLLLPNYYFTSKSSTIISDFVARLSKLWLYDHQLKSYRDSWIETGLPMYLGMVYYYTYYENKNHFFRLLSDMEHAVLGFSDGISIGYSDMGPISLGIRAENLYTPKSNIFNGIKSVYVFHMLRNMFMDYANGMNEQMFLGVMRDYYESFKGKKYSTEDFRLLLEKHCGYSLKWFFDQWVDGTAIPTYEFDSDIQKNADGNYIVKCKLKQKDVPADFKMLIPVQVKFDDDTFYMQRVQMIGKEITFDIGPFEEEPDDVIFNPYSSVLCNID